MCLTVNALNVYYLDEICEWIPKQKFNYVYFNVLHDAWYFSIKHLTEKAKDIIYEKYKDYNGPYADEVKNLMTFMNLGKNSDGTDLIKVLKQSDKQRNQMFSDNHPEMAAVIGYE